MSGRVMSAPSLSAWAMDEATARRFRPSETLALVAIARLAKNSPSVTDLMRETRLCRASIMRALVVIEQSGLVGIERRVGHPSTYRLLQPQGGVTHNHRDVSFQPEGCLIQPQGCLTETQGRARVDDLPSPKEERKEETGHKIPLDWKPNSDAYGFGRSKGLTPEEIADLGEKFRFDYLANGTKLTDFDAKFKGYLVSQSRWKKDRAQTPPRMAPKIDPLRERYSWRMTA